MDLLNDLKALVEKYSTNGVFLRTGGTERQLDAYIITYKGADRNGPFEETSITVASSAQEAKVKATKPYGNVEVILCEKHNIANNQTICRMRK